MSINLKKGQRIDLTKGDSTLNRVIVGLGWDPIESSNGRGLLSSLFGGAAGYEFDCDASVFMLDENGKINNINDLIYFGNLRSKCGSIIHTGDNLTGEGEGDDEQIIVELSKIRNEIKRLLFVVNIYECIKRNQHFGMIRNAYIRLVNDNGKKELVRYNLTENYSGKTALLVGEIYRHNGEWKFAAIGEGTTDTGLNDICKKLSY